MIVGIAMAGLPVAVLDGILFAALVWIINRDTRRDL